jgi:undecaprenyl-diphosphatase
VSRWAFVRLAALLLARWRTAWAMQSEDARRTWRRTLIGGAVALPLVTIALVALGHALVAAGALDWETAWLRRLEASSFSFSSAVWFQTFGSDIALAVLTLTLAGIAVWAGRPLLALAIPLSWIGVDIAVRLGWALWARSRPELVFGGAAAPGFHAFPSGHAGKTFAVYGLLVWVWVRASGSWVERIIALGAFAFIAVVVPVGRLRMGAHWPSDVIAGALIGAFWLGVLILSIRRERPVPAATPPAPAPPV